MAFFANLFARFRDYVLTRLQQPRKSYRYHIYNHLGNLQRHIRKGDVVLVEGRSHLSQLIKLFSVSHWSHASMYVGDELIREHRSNRQQYLERFGDDAHHLLVEAIAGKGVIATPLREYRDYNLRVCRPFAISDDDLRLVLENIIAQLGNRYDEQNIIDLALMSLPALLNPFKKRSISSRLGQHDDYQVICSGMIARAFQQISYPVVPALQTRVDEDIPWERYPYGSVLQMRNFTQILPRDFDLSPNFAIVKFNIIEGGVFNYKQLTWSQEGEVENAMPRRA